MAQEEKKAAKVYIDVSLESGLHENRIVDRFRVTLTIPGIPNAAQHASMGALAGELFEQYRMPDGAKPHYPFEVRTFAEPDSAGIEAIEHKTGTLRANFEDIVARIRESRNRPVAGIEYVIRRSPGYGNDGNMWQDIYDVEVRISKQLI